MADRSPIQHIIDGIADELRALAQAKLDAERAPCAACGEESYCNAARNGRFFCTACYDSKKSPRI